MHKTAAALPVIFGLGLGKHRHISQIGHAGSCLQSPVMQIEIGLAAAAPVQPGRPGQRQMLHPLDDGLDRGKAGAAGQQHDRLVAVLAQEEAAHRAFHAQNVFFLQRAKDMVGELAAWHMAQMQLDRAGCTMRCVGH